MTTTSKYWTLGHHSLPSGWRLCRLPPLPCWRLKTRCHSQTQHAHVWKEDFPKGGQSSSEPRQSGYMRMHVYQHRWFSILMLSSSTLPQHQVSAAVTWTRTELAKAVMVMDSSISPSVCFHSMLSCYALFCTAVTTQSIRLDLLCELRRNFSWGTVLTTEESNMMSPANMASEQQPTGMLAGLRACEVGGIHFFVVTWL